MLNCIEHAPKNIAFELKRTNRGILQLRRAALLDGDFKRFARIAPGLSDSTTEIIETLQVDPAIKFFEGSEPSRHQIGGKKFRKR